MHERSTLDAWLAAHHDPKLPPPPPGHPILVVPAGDLEFGRFTPRWLDFADAMCDDGPRRVDEYAFHPEVPLGPNVLRCVHVITNPPGRLFEGEGDYATLGFFEGPEGAVRKLVG